MNNTKVEQTSLVSTGLQEQLMTANFSIESYN